MAEAVFRHLAERARLADYLAIASAGTHDYNVGLEPDDRARRAAAGRGYPMNGMRARQLNQDDFEKFHYLLAMDNGNLADLKKSCPAEYQHKLGLFMEYGTGHRGVEIPDPYPGGKTAFELVLDLVENAAAGLLEHIRRELSI